MQRPLQIRHTFIQMGTVIYRSYHIVLGFRKIFFFSRTLWYGSIDIPSVWDTLVNDIPALKTACEEILTHF